MASAGNPNQPGGGQFMDVHHLFNQQSSNPSAPQNPNPSSSYPTPSLPYPPPPSASYPPPSSPYAFHQYPPHQMSNLHHQRSLPYPTPPQQPNPNAAGAALMSLLTPPSETQHPIHRVNTPPTLFPNNNTNPSLFPNSNTNLPPSLALFHNNTTSMPSFSNISTNPPLFANNSTTPPPSSSPMMRLPSSKLPKGRHLIGERAVYDIDVRMEGEVQPQLEVAPITKYVSDPGLVLGRQIAVNKTYICYGLKMGAIRVLNINTASRSLLKGLAQRVTDMAFFAEDVHLLASASVDGRIYVWRITEVPGKEDKAEITGKIIIAIQIVGEGESVHPRVCWHCHKQELLVIGIGRSVLRIDTTKVGKAKVNSTEEPLRFSIDNLIDGVQLVGKHEGEVTDLSMCQWMTTRLVSASADGTIKIWEDRKAQPLLVLRPYDGQPVNSVTFLTAPTRPDHIILITGGPLNREMKIWVSGSEEGWLLPSDAESWHCIQTLDFKSSASRVEESFFNQVVALPQAGLLLLANAKKNAIYAVHLDYGANPISTCMDYVAEFTVTMPILSFTGTSGTNDSLPHGEHLIQVFCVQTHAIQQYALDLSQCFPPPIENLVLEKSNSVNVRDSIDSEGFASLEQPVLKPVEISLTSSAPRHSVQDIGSEPVAMPRHPPRSTSMDTAISADTSTLSLESKPISAISSNNDISCVVSSPLSLSPRSSEKFSGLRCPANGLGSVQVSDDCRGDKQVTEFSVDRKMDNACVSDVPPVEDDSRSNEKKVVRGDTSSVHNQPGKFKHPTHLVTPSEILMAASSDTSNGIEHISEGEPKVQDVTMNSDERNVEMDVKVVGETGFSQGKNIGSHGELPSLAVENKEKIFCSQASDLGMEMARECSALSPETYPLQKSSSLDRTNVNEALTEPSNVDDKVHDTTEDTFERNEGLEMPAAVLEQVTPTMKGKKQKGKNTLASGSAATTPSTFNSAELTSDLAVSSRVSSTEQNLPQNMAIMEMLVQMEASRKEDQKQMMAVAKEIRRVEAAVCKMVEKSSKANSDALWSRVQEDFAKQEKLARERQQQITNLITNSPNKELPVIVEKIIKKELAAVGQAVARAVTPVIEKTVSTTIADSFQRGVGDKAVNLLEKSVNSKLEATVSRQIQSQFQNSGKQAIQEALRISMEATVVPAFDRSCKAMFEQVDATFQKGMIEHSAACQQQYDSAHSSLAAALKDVINSASSLTQTLTVELADGQRKLVALAVAGANSKAANPLITQLSNGPLGAIHDKIEAPLDPTKKLSRLVFECKYEEAFTAALQKSDVSIVSWLCSQVDLHKILSVAPIPLSQGVLLSLLQQLACDITNDTSRKLGWMTDVAMAINPSDALIAVHVRPIFEQVYQILNHHRSLPTASSAELSSVRILMHVINSMLISGK